MSYTEQIREIFASDIPKEKQKRELLLCGILTNAAISECGISAKAGSAHAFELARELCRLLRNLSPSVSQRACGGRIEYSFLCENQKLAAFVSEFKGELAGRISSAEELRYYLRGLFLVSGRITDPDTEAHMEFSLCSEELAEGLCSIIEELGFDKPGMSKRRDKFILYYKSRDRISNVLTLMDAGTLVFDYINRAIFKSLEWDAHRAINMISGNISRSVTAGEHQAAACRFLLDSKKDTELSSELYTTALLRVNNVNLSLSELAAVHTPPLTKSGLNNRMKKIIAIAEKNGFDAD